MPVGIREISPIGDQNTQIPSNPHLWQIRWVRDLAVLTAALLVLWAAYLTRSVTAPILIGATLAYIFNPLITYADKKWRLPRWGGAAIILTIVLIAMIGFVALAVPSLAKQTDLLLDKLPRYAELAGSQLGIDVNWNRLTRQLHTAAQVDSEQMRPIGQAIVFAFNVIRAALLAIIGFITYVPIATIIIAFCFFFFCWHWAAILAWFDQFIPKKGRDTTLDVLVKMDRSVSAFIRGRLMQALVMGVILSIGWWIAGVPYWLLLGMGCGLLNLVPFLAAVGWIVAITLATVDHLSTPAAFNIMVLVWPTAVYLVAQALDGWVIEPVVQGKATNLDPLTVLLAVLIGGSLAGLLGMLLAIPAAACIKILGHEVIVPRLREYTAKIE